MSRWKKPVHNCSWIYTGIEYKEENYPVRCIKAKQKPHK